MTAVKKFIIEACNKIQSVFPQVTLAYQYKAASETHFIKISPPNIYDEEKFLDLYFSICDEFNEISDDALCFLNNESLSELTEAELICTPEKAEYVSYRAFFDVSADSHSDVSVFGEKPVAVAISKGEEILEKPFASEVTVYAMAA